MVSPISAKTHKEYQNYSMQDALKLYSFMSEMHAHANTGGKAPYNTETYLRHAIVNRQKLKKLIHTATKQRWLGVFIDARLLFWVYRGCNAMGVKSPIELPHICKIPSTEGESFFVTTKDEWSAHRKATMIVSKQTQVSDHAKLQYLTRVLGINVDGMLAGFPKVHGNCETLKDGRKAYTVGDHVYIYDDKVCVTILSKNMVAI